MAIEILMPALSPTMTIGNVANWLKKEGDSIKSGDIIAEIETDKAVMELEASDSGTLGKILVTGGTNDVKVGTLIALMLKPGEDSSSLSNYTPKSSTNSTTSSMSDVKMDLKKQENEPNTKVENTLSSNSARVFASPLAKRIANQNGIDLNEVEGTGPHGRIVKSDVLAFEPNDIQTFSKVAASDKKIPHTQIRKVIAKRLVESKQNVPHFYLSLDVNITDLLASRSVLNKKLEDSGLKTKISVNDMIIKACAMSLADFPDVNASWTDDAMILHGSVDVSVAVSIEGGLITPIIKNANFKGLREISDEMKILAKKAKDGKLKPEEFQGGGFSISNLGMFGIKSFNAIVNPPQSAILSVGAATKVAIQAKNGQIEFADILNLSVSCDHRVVDGTLAAKFLNKIKDYLETPILMCI